MDFNSTNQKKKKEWLLQGFLNEDIPRVRFVQLAGRCSTAPPTTFSLDLLKVDDERGAKQNRWAVQVVNALFLSKIGSRLSRLTVSDLYLDDSFASVIEACERNNIQSLRR